MITQIQVRNLAIVERLDLDLQSGLTVVTGETGAGKSIVVDALAFALGERSDTSVIRSGCDRAEVSVCFEPDDRSIVPAWLTAQELDLDGECVLRRTLSKEGRSRASINGRTVTLQTLRELGNLLADIHGQHAHQSLLHRDQQRDLLDQFGDYHKQCTQVRDSYRQWHACAQQLTALREQVHDRNARLELLRYQVPELDALELQNGEVPQLEADHRRLSHANELLDTAQRSLTQLYEDDEHAANSQIGRVLVQLRELTTLAPVTTEFETIGLIGKNDDTRVAETLASLCAHLQGRHNLLVETTTAAMLGDQVITTVAMEALRQRCDLAIVVGGDGTLLHAGHCFADAGPPLLGINLGRLGFLVDISPN